MNTQNSSLDVNQWAMFLHLSQLSSIFVPILGFLVPILIWQLNKEEMPELDAHGKVVANWMISEFIYLIVAGILSFVIIGLILLPVIIGVSIVFPIIGGVQANNGKLWKYPLSLKIFP